MLRSDINTNRIDSMKKKMERNLNSVYNENLFLTSGEMAVILKESVKKILKSHVELGVITRYRIDIRSKKNEVVGKFKVEIGNPPYIGWHSFGWY